MKYDRITFHSMNGGIKTVIIRDLAMRTTNEGRVTFSGFAVSRNGEEPSGPRQFFIIGESDLIKRVPLRMNLKYEELEPTTDEARSAYR